MSRIHIRNVILRRWFPPNDVLATTVARLCILREDFYLEMQGIVQNPMNYLDKNTAAWRHNYFFRNYIRTLAEIMSAIELLLMQKEFKDALSREPIPLQESFEKYVPQLRDARKLLKFVRNKICGHVGHKDVQRALSLMDFDRRGLIEIGEKYTDIHYKFTSELFVAILQAGDPDKNIADRDIQEVLDLSETMASFLPFLTLIDNILSIYVRTRRLE